MKNALCFSILILALFANSSVAQTHPVCGFARQPSPNLVLAADAAGNLFINFGISGTDSLEGDYRIRKVSPNNVITTFAGGGKFATGLRGGPAPGTIREIPNGGQATSMPFVTTNLAAGDSTNNLYVATTMRGPIVRKISPSGVITTIAGTGVRAFSGDGGPATAADLGIVNAIAVDAGGNLYLAETFGRIRKVDSSGIITTIAGTGARGGLSGTEGPAISAELAFITDIALDGAGNLFIAETTGAQAQANPPWARRIRKITPAGIISTVYTKQ